MALNIEYIEGSIDVYKRTSFLARQIKRDAGPFLPQSCYASSAREYLSEYQLKTLLRKNGFSGPSLGAMLSFIHDSISGAFERGVFVVSSRVVELPDSVEPTSPQGLIDYLRGQELEYFTPKLWYPEGVYTKGLMDDGWVVDVANEWGPFILRHSRVAFEIGIKSAAERLVCH